MTTESVAPEKLHAWAIYLQAGEEARRRGDRRVGTDHLLLALLEAPSIEAVLGVNLQQARQALESLDHEALGALGLGPGTGADAPPLPMRAVPKKPRIRDVAKKDRFRMTPAAKKVLEEAYKPKGHRKLQVTGPEVLAQILALEPPDPAAVLLGALGVNKSEVRRRLDLPSKAQHETHSDAAAPSNGQPRE
jgi:ATP-dependent Clp protease ATP-binding subunit ClpA